MTILATTSTSSSRIRDDRDEEPLSLDARPPRSHEPSGATHRQIDAAILAYVQNVSSEREGAARTQAPASSEVTRPPPSPKNDRILYVGMNDASKNTEANGLRASGASVTTVLRRDGTTVSLDGANYDLADKEGCKRFADALSKKYGLPTGAAGILFDALDDVPASARDEVARIAMALAPGERGAPIPSRLVFSGHSNGSDVHMDGESLKFASVLTLMRAMPNAALQIEDIHFSGCFTSAQIYDVDQWRGACPNLKTMWGYSGIAPGTPVGHLQSWAHATRGRTANDPVRGARGNVTTWSAQQGIRTGVSLETLRENQVRADRVYEQLRNGDIASGPWGQAKEPYETYRELSYRPELSAQEKAIMAAKAEVLLRVRFHATVSSELVTEHGGTIRGAYESLGLPVPDFTQLSRKEAMDAIGVFEAKARARSPLPAAAAKARAILKGLRELDPAVIPSAWCH